jgi:soluble lytic murein transglycosylase-like protein/lipopolysaccharide biosynthesis regulator YciM
MLVALVLLLTIAETPFQSSVDQALGLVQSRDWKAAMTALDRAWAEDPTVFEANNLHYLRGRVAEEQKDWGRATEEFGRVGPQNPLRPLAAWHGANAAMRLGAMDRASQLVDELPADFPSELRIRLAREAPPALALKILNAMTSREARFRRAILLGDVPALWTLLRQSNSDEVAVESARRLQSVAADSRDWRDLASAFVAQRQFPQAIAAWERLVRDSEFAAEAQYQLARIRLLTYDYAGAFERYRAVAAAFPGTDWEKDAEYQAGNSLWRLRQYREAEKAFLSYIDNNKSRGTPESAIRDLADIYRSLGETAKAISLIDRALAGRLTTGTRQVLIFTKAKILYAQEKFPAALQLIRQLKGARLQTTSGGTTAEEVAYFEALCLEKTGTPAAAKAAWLKLASSPNTYYGQRAAQKAGRAPPPSPPVCAGSPDPVMEQVQTRLAQRRRGLQTSIAGAPKDAVSELVFLQLWDEASLWLDRTRRPDAALAADVSYAAGRYNRAILYADRLGPAASGAQALVYPPAFRASICKSAAQFGVDPLWLHAIIWQESKYDPAAQSAAAARGLMQFIPDTAEAIAKDAGIVNLTLDRLYDADTSIQLGAYYWSTLMAEFKSPELALAAYNGGPDNVRRWKDKWPDSDGEFFVSDIGFTETKRYVQAVFGARAVYGRLH